MGSPESPYLRSFPLGPLGSGDKQNERGCLRLDAGFRVEGWGFRVQGLGLRVQGSGLRVQGSGFTVEGSRFRVEGLGLRASAQQLPKT